jgi:hypothetical protein
MKIAHQRQSAIGEFVAIETRIAPIESLDRSVRTDTRPRIRAELCARAREVRNIEEGLLWVDHSEFHLSTAMSHLERVVDCLSADLERPGRVEAAQVVVVEAFDSILAAANSRLGDRPLFGGFAEVDPVSLENGVWSYVGDSGRIMKRVLATGTIAINLPGDALFGFAAGDSVLHLLDGLFRDLEIGPEVSALAGDLEACVRRLQDGMAEFASVRSRLSSALVQAMVEQNRLRRYLGEAGGSVECSDRSLLQAATYQVAVDVFSRALQPSLVDFLR